MQQVVDLILDAQTSVKMRWNEPYVTEGLNRKLDGVLPRGVYRGWTLAPGTNPLWLLIQADATSGDCVLMYTTAGGYTLHVCRAPGNLQFDLTALAGQTVVIAVFATYVTGAPTTAVIRAYQLSPVDEFDDPLLTPEKGELIVLGTVIVPAAGLIPAANISSTLRTMAWDQIAHEARPWFQLLNNGSFEEGPVQTFVLGDPAFPTSTTQRTRFPFDSRIPFWSGAVFTQTGRTFECDIIDTDSFDGGQCFRIQATANQAPFQINFIVLYHQLKPILTTGRRFRERLAYKTPLGFSGGPVNIVATFASVESTVNPTTTTVTLGSLDLTASATWKTFEAIFIAPAGFTRLTHIELNVGAPLTVNTAAAPEDLLLLDAFSLEVEVTDLMLNDMLTGRMQTQTFLSLVWEDQSLNSSRDKLITSYGNAGDDLGNTQGLVTTREDQSSSAVWPVFAWQGMIQAGTWGSTNAISKKRAAYQAHSSNTTYIPVIQGNQSPGTEPLSILYVRVNPFALVLAIGCRWNDVSGLWENLNLSGGTYVPMKIEFGTVLGPSGASIRGIRAWRRVSNVATWDDGVTSTGWEATPASGNGDFYESALMAFALEASSAFTDLISSTPGALAIGQYLSGLAGLGVVDSQQSEAIPRIKTTNSAMYAMYTLVAEFGRKHEAPPDKPIRLYLSANAADWNLHITYNARWDQVAAEWVADDPTFTVATRLSMGHSVPVGSTSGNTGDSGLSFQLVAVGAGTWVDSAWGAAGDLFGVVENSGLQMILGSLTGSASEASLQLLGLPTTGTKGATVQLQSSNIPSSQAARANTLYSKNITKAWGYISANSGTPLVLDGFGFSSASYSGDALRLTLSIVNNNSTFYTVTANTETGDCNVHAVPFSDSVFDIYAEVSTTGAPITLNGSGQHIGFIVLTTQD